MEFVCEETKHIEDGKHAAHIHAIEYRDQPYKYVDVVFELLSKNHVGIKIKTGFPQSLTKESKFGKFLQEFGVLLEVGTKVDPEKILIGKTATFTTYNEKTQKGTFARIVQETIKYIPPKQQQIKGKVERSKDELVAQFNDL